MTDKTAQFAKMFDFFTSLATGNYRHLLPKKPAPDTCTAPGPCTLPPSPHDKADNEVPGHSQKIVQDQESLLQSTIPVPVESAATEEQPEPDEAADASPLPQDYSFTFKAMVHNLYEARDFAQMVARVLRASQQTFRPLPDSLKGRPKRPMGKMARPLEDDEDDAEAERVRAQKKRCVARRADEEARWVYRAAHAQPVEPVVTFARAAPVKRVAIPRARGLSTMTTAAPRPRRGSNASPKKTEVPAVVPVGIPPVWDAAVETRGRSSVVKRVVSSAPRAERREEVPFVVRPGSVFCDRSEEARVTGLKRRFLD